MELTTSLNRRKYQQRQEMLHTMNSFRKSQAFCDVYLVVNDSRLPAHKVVLAASSPVFKAKFTSELIGEKSGNDFQVDLPEFHPDSKTIEELLNYVYTGDIGISEENAEELLVIADYFDIPSLKETCAAFLINSLKPSNCLAIQLFAERYRHDLLHEAATEYICNHLAAIWKTEEFLSSDFSDVKELICGERLVIKRQKGEEEVFDGIRAWVNHDTETRERFFAQLFRHVRLSAMSFQFIAEVIDHDEFVTRSNDCKNLVTAALMFPDDERDDPRGATEGIVLLSKNGCASCYIPATETWFDLARLKSFNEVRTVTICKGTVYAIGWGNNCLTVEKFDPQKNIWSEKLSFRSRLPMAAVTVEDNIYLIKEHYVTRFKPAENSWQDVAPMDDWRRGLCAVVLNGLVYAIGGYDGRRQLALSSVERYDPTIDKWEYVNHFMKEKRGFASATVMGNKILVVGGMGDFCRPLQNCELYDPTTDVWSLLGAELYVPHSNAAIGKAKNKISVFGGTHSNGIVECYDRDQEEWSKVEKIPSATTFNHACVTWLPKALFKSLKGIKLHCDQQND
ncbi:kelch-like protein 28 [Oculina patagonica]